MVHIVCIYKEVIYEVEREMCLYVSMYCPYVPPVLTDVLRMYCHCSAESGLPLQ